MTTATTPLDSLLPLVDDLARELPESERYRRLLGALRSLVPCDASALLRLDGDELVPLAVDGLSDDTLGRRFRVADHPRFAALLAHPEPTLFPADSPLPDPYDGLVAAAPRLDVHDCMGCPLHVDGKPWGLLTLDALHAGSFEAGDLATLRAFASLAAATVTAAERMHGLERAAERERSRAESFRLAAGQTASRSLVGRSPAMRRLHDDIATVAHSDLTVLIRGETGSGKELVAQAIHAASARGDRPLIAVNCAALPDMLLESELFGHVRGAFSGATSDRRGKFELADHGTLFLDEVADLSLAAQAALLRVMQSGHLQRVGSDRDHRVDVRIIAASNRDLADEVRAGRCRADFYHRISVYPIEVPALRDRGNDVLIVAGTFLEENRARLGLSGLRLAPESQAALLAWRWPGNVRELEHTIGRAALKALARSGRGSRALTIEAADLDLAEVAQPQPATVAPMPDAPGLPLRASVDAYERRLIDDALRRHRQSWAAAARELGVDRANLRRSALRLGLIDGPSRG
ncbi:anaerobic nitric oxide reductase transcription regulator [Luteibacter sp. UNCMF331Sha3.1]|uniref:nitric oxide reductase transcriptional regulator NorR n=1 Tax=Luteibacter sp. UNCMF331Sha3.1 TaxID=1502760 RepID=UPI0008D6015F|nr:nitric oxide reductase transcriptional regulator NorR [Luteibacter sp. UNCMF331Sha3.1]SEM59198.1 anaerobic nitric oxide reductase transcription regulator [Luteibacter sp. UNCMF331Sha3.1]